MSGKYPLISEERERSSLSKYYVCPTCGKKVGGYIITGNGADDWSYKKDNFCSNCGQKILWDKEHTGVKLL